MATQDNLAVGRRRYLRHPLVVLAATTLTVAVLGVPSGFVWAAIAPRVALVVTGHGAGQVANPETKAFIAGDGWFCVIGIVGGLLAGIAGYLVAVRRRGALAALGLILGGLAAALLAWWIGRSVGLASFRNALTASRPGTVLHAPLVLRAHGAVVIWPLTSALLVALAELLTGPQRDAAQDAALYPPGSAPPSKIGG